MFASVNLVKRDLFVIILVEDGRGITEGRFKLKEDAFISEKSTLWEFWVCVVGTVVDSFKLPGEVICEATNWKSLSLFAPFCLEFLSANLRPSITELNCLFRWVGDLWKYWLDVDGVYRFGELVTLFVLLLTFLLVYVAF